jgi:hypothetical protein
MLIQSNGIPSAGLMKGEQDEKVNTRRLRKKPEDNEGDPNAWTDLGPGVGSGSGGKHGHAGICSHCGSE